MCETEWQDINKWNVLISSLTLPESPPVVMTHIGRKNITLEWRSLYNPSYLDKTLFGFNITTCVDGVELEYCEVQTFIRSSGGTLMERVDEELSSREGTDVVVFTVFLSNLLPDTAYKFRSTMFVGTSHSNPSEWSRLYTTPPLSIPSSIHGSVKAIGGDVKMPVVLLFNLPIDDGGLPILKFIVRARNHNENFQQKWKVYGNFNASNIQKYSLSNDRRYAAYYHINLFNLIPDCMYDFMISAVNDMGESLQSESSNTFKISSKHVMYTPDLILQGLKSESEQITTYVETANDGFVISKLKNSMSNGEILLNDTAQKISIANEFNEIIVDVWSCHYSPSKFAVRGAGIWVDSSSFSVLEDTNDERLEGKIAVLLRDGEPISSKARKVQMAGAVGCIVIDSGRCSEYNQKCFPGSEKGRGELFGEVDPPRAWESIRIPVVFSLYDTSSRQFLETAGISI